MKIINIIFIFLLLILGGCSPGAGESIADSLTPNISNSLDLVNGDAVIEFTENAVLIETRRHELANDNTPYGRNSLVRALPDLESEMTWLECPDVLRDVKSALVRAYQLENLAVSLDSAVFSVNYANYDSPTNQILFSTRYSDRPELLVWFMAQRLRCEAYQKWGQILISYGLSPPPFSEPVNQ